MSRWQRWIMPLSVLAFVPGCGEKTQPTRITIAHLGDAFIDIEKANADWLGKRVIVSGGKVERVKADYVYVVGDTSDRTYQVDLICYHKGAENAALARAVRGQEVTVSGRVGSNPGGTNVLIQLEDCEFELGAVPAGKAILASRGRGQVEADEDMAAGKLHLRVRLRDLRDPPPWLKEYQRLMKDKCDVIVDVKREAGPIAGLTPDDREYNEIMTAEIEKRFGAGIVAKLKKQAGVKEK